MKKTGAVGVAAMAAGIAGGPLGAEELAQAMPKIKLGPFEVSRFILGANPFAGYAHRPGTDLETEMKAFYTDERIMAVLDEAAACGITAVSVWPGKWWFDLWAKYKSRGGRMPAWISQPMPAPEKMKEEIADSVKNGAKAVYVQGHCVEREFEGGTFDTCRGWLEHIKSLGVGAGLAAHRPDVHLEAEKRKFPADFYFQCFYNVAHGDKVYSAEDRQKAVEAMAQIEKPVVGYKILGAGRFPAAESFAFALKHLRARDGFCVGVFPKDNPHEIREDVRLALGR